MNGFLEVLIKLKIMGVKLPGQYRKAVYKVTGMDVPSYFRKKYGYYRR